MRKEEIMQKPVHQSTPPAILSDPRGKDKENGKNEKGH